jgi:hypothetical protein
VAAEEAGASRPRDDFELGERLPAADVARECPESIREQTFEVIKDLDQSRCFFRRTGNGHFAPRLVSAIHVLLELVPQSPRAGVRSPYQVNFDRVWV